MAGSELKYGEEHDLNRQRIGETLNESFIRNVFV